MRNALLPQTTTLALSLGTILSGALLVEIVFGYAGMGARALLPRPRLIIADEPVSMVDASLRATILDTLRRLNQSFGISVIYITHDLTTAYQIADNIVVMYRGAAVEAGDLEHVVKNPLHPYSQLLVASIPLPDPAHAWQRDATPVDTTEPPVVGLNSCRFADRCPYVMPVCHTAPPPLFHGATTRRRPLSLRPGASTEDPGPGSGTDQSPA